MNGYDRQKQACTVEFNKIAQMLAQRCSSAEARSEAESLLPGHDFARSLHLLAETDCAYSLLIKHGSPSFYGLAVRADTLGLAAAGATLSIPQLIQIESCMRVVRGLISYGKGCGEDCGILTGYFGRMASFRDIEERIDRSIESEDRLSDAASPELAQIRRKIRAAQESARSRLNSVATSQSTAKYLQEQSVMMRDGRFVVPVKVEFRAYVPGLIHGASASGATLFVEPASVVEANNEIKILESKERAETERILLELSGLCGKVSGPLLAGCRAAVQLEIIFAKADLGASMNGFVPEYNDEGIIDIKKARHPLIDPKKTVAVDIRLGGSFDSLIITGPNTGGKTVILKTVGLFCMMADCGMMIPAAQFSRVSRFDKILADIGDEQSIEQSLSTFSSHITNIVGIMKEATSRSLVLLDELGAGTDPAEGAALAIAILKSLRAAGAKVIATTHYAELKQYAILTPGVVNGCCEFDIETLKPTYRLLIGIPGSSNAFAISQRLGIDPSVIESARQTMDSKTAALDEVMRLLEEKSSVSEKEAKEAERIRREAEKERAAQQAALKKEKENFEREIGRQRTEQLRITAHLRFESKKLLDEINAMRKSAGSNTDELARRARSEINAKVRELEQTADPVFEPEPEECAPSRPLKIGDTVIISGLGKRGTVIALPGRGGKATLRTDLGKVEAKISSLRLASEKTGSGADGHVSYSGICKADREVSPSIMIRHMDLAEATPVTEQYLDDCVVNGLPSATIIHGKGTGTLRRMVHQLLKNNPNVKSFRLGKYGEGEDGVTVVEFK